MAQMNDNTFKYQIIKDYITNLIKKKELGPDERIPSEAELSKAFNMSTITVRRSLSDLVNEMKIYRIKGKGSFVASDTLDYREQGQLKNRVMSFVLSAKQGIDDNSFMKMTRGIQSYLISHGYSLIIEYSNECLETEKQIINRLIEDGVRGIIYFSANPDENISILKKMRDRNIPFILVDRYAKSFPANSVISDNFGGMYSSTEYIQGLGHKKISFITYSGCYLSSESDRFDGYCKAMENAGLSINNNIIFDYSQINDGRLVTMIRNNDITAIMAVNDIVAIEIMRICDQNGINIPYDVSILGFDDIDQAAYQKVPLSSVKQNFDIMGSEAARTLIKILKNPDMACRKMELPTKLIMRKSTSSVNI